MPATALQYANGQFRTSYNIGRMCRFGCVNCALHAVRVWFGAYRYGKSVGL